MLKSITEIKLLPLRLFFRVCFLILALKPDVHAQSGFAKAIPIDANVNIDDILYHEDQLIIRGNIGIDSLSLVGLLLAGLDTMGNLLWTKVIYDTTFTSHLVTNTPGRFLVTSDQRLIIPVNYYNTGDLAIYYTDLEGQELFHQFYPYDGFNIFPYDLVELDGYYYVTGTNTYEGGEFAPFVLKISSDGEMVWIKYYGLPNEYEESIDVDINPDHTITLSSTKANRDFVQSEGREGWKKPWIFTIDTSGSIISEWIGEKNDSRTLGGEYFLRLDNGDWIIQSTHFKNVPTPFGEAVRTSPTVTRLDSNFNQLWKIYLSNYEDRSDRIADMDIDSVDQSIIITGNKYISILDKYEYVNWTVKIDTTGHVIWNKTDSIYYSRQNSHYTAGLDIAPSGSIYVAGYVTANELEPRSQAFVIKYTSDGCSDTLCTTTSINEQIKQADSPVVLYPNPASDILNVVVRESTGPCQIVLSDMHGRVFMSKSLSAGRQEIVLELPAGLYIASFSNSRGLIYSKKLVIY